MEFEDAKGRFARRRIAPAGAAWLSLPSPSRALGRCRRSPAPGRPRKRRSITLAEIPLPRLNPQRADTPERRTSRSDRRRCSPTASRRQAPASPSDVGRRRAASDGRPPSGPGPARRRRRPTGRSGRPQLRAQVLDDGDSPPRPPPPMPSPIRSTPRSSTGWSRRAASRDVSARGSPTSGGASPTGPARRCSQTRFEQALVREKPAPADGHPGDRRPQAGHRRRHDACSPAPISRPARRPRPRPMPRLLARTSVSRPRSRRASARNSASC